MVSKMTNFEILSSNSDANPCFSDLNSEIKKSSRFGDSLMFELSRFKFMVDDIK